jgi:polar amino acid transport system substrate-binding protein
LISAGTEKVVVDSGRKSLLGRAKERPDLVKQVLAKVRREGLLKTYAAVQTKLEGKTALGYSAAGSVIAIGDGVSGFSIGDRVACAGFGYASHAEVISVPQNLCVRIPDGLGFDEAAFGTLGAIALQGVRLAEPTLGESVVVIGLGLLGQITIQLLKANGCRVYGVDLDKDKLQLARELGAEMCSVPADAKEQIRDWSRGRGVDVVMITAATPSNDPIELAGEISRPKGRVVVVGLVGMDVPRNTYYRKELSLQVSMSYGPGRYDAEYEERGHDYPFGYVRWTEARNLEAFLDLAATKKIDLGKLISHHFRIEDGESAYKLISGETKEPYLGIVLKYDQGRSIETEIVYRTGPAKSDSGIGLGMIGAGDYARGMLLPNFKANGVDFRSITTASGLSARTVGSQYQFAACVSDAKDVIDDDSVNLVVIASRHDTHAALAQKTLERGKHVFVEKPLALTVEELDSVIEAAMVSKGRLMVGYNRRFSPAAVEAKALFAVGHAPLSILYRVNGGRIPREHWVQDPVQGGGRIIGEVCHFVDLMHYLTDSITTRVYAEAIAIRNHDAVAEDSVFVTLKFADGSNGSIAYLAEGDGSLSKERVEIFGGGKAFVIDDFRSASAYSNGKGTARSFGKQDKGQAAEVRSVCSLVRDGGEPPIALGDLAAASRVTFCILESLRSGEVCYIDSRSRHNE